VLACPTSARLFGDIHDPQSVVSKAIEERGGNQLMPEWNTRPANHYLPRVPTAATGCGGDACSCKTAGSLAPDAAGPLDATHPPASLDAQLESGKLHLASMATRI
jgi:hypothetical protein